MRYLNGRVTHIFTNKIPPHNTIAYNKKLSKTFTQHTLGTEQFRKISKNLPTEAGTGCLGTQVCAQLSTLLLRAGKQAVVALKIEISILSLSFCKPLIMLLGYQYLCTCGSFYTRRS